MPRTRALNTYHVQLFAKFVEKLQATPDGDGTLLDHSMILYGSGMSNANVHAPVPAAARARWAARQGKGHRHVVQPERTPWATSGWRSAEKFGVPDTTGSATARAGRRHAEA